MNNFFTLWLPREDAYGNLEFFAKGCFSSEAGAKEALGNNQGEIMGFETREDCLTFLSNHA